MSVRSERVERELKEILSFALIERAQISQHGLVTVQKVKITPDLKAATVFVSFFGSEEQEEAALEMLDSERNKLQALVAKKLQARHSPKIKFVKDEKTKILLALERKLHNEKNKTPS